ncbi:hypothetical protein OG413_44280 [Streptomyces sp. NBC_01433]|uniref:hypothetical protein n=1 Tax=Streptomyces sp. NBC_01433 TaxID=2903864 RepID=UPI00224EE2B4|nr:hypothetical protein [Streptomyces sp. NBC_01433]MCX4682202.1 hypothetical protein [Streptomyces sp. NBC_01433]
MTTSSDLTLRISVAVADLLLVLRVHLPGFGATGPFAAFHDTSSERVRQVPGRGTLTAAGGAV